MKKRSIYNSVIGIFLVLLTCFFAANTSFVYAQSNELPGFDFLKKFVELANKYNSTNCPDSLKDQTGKCLDFNQIAQRCWIEDKKDKDGNYDPACCRINDQCPTGQTCSVGNNWCKSGFSCNPNTAPTTSPQSPTANPQNPAPTTTTQQPTGGNSAEFTGNFKYFCQGDPKWRDNGCGNPRDLTFNGCCPTSVAMAAATLGVNTDPVQVDKMFRANNLRSCGGYCVLASNDAHNNKLYVENWLNSNNLKVGIDLVTFRPEANTGVFNCELAKQALNAGNILLAYSGTYKCGKSCGAATQYFSGHAFIIDKVWCDSNEIRVRDPSNCTNDNDEGQEFRWWIKDASIVTGYGVFPIVKK